MQDIIHYIHTTIKSIQFNPSKRRLTVSPSGPKAYQQRPPEGKSSHDILYSITIRVSIISIGLQFLITPPRFPQPPKGYQLPRLMMARRISMVIVMVVVMLQEEMLVCTVPGKRNGGNPQTGEEALEAVESAEGTGVSPCFTSWVRVG